MPSLHSSMLHRETIAHNVERGSPVHVVLVDTRKAFDQVWIDGVFYMLSHMGMDFCLWKLLRNLYTIVKCTVKVSRVTSKWFCISQGVHLVVSP